MVKMLLLYISEQSRPKGLLSTINVLLARGFHHRRTIIQFSGYNQVQMAKKDEAKTS